MKSLYYLAILLLFSCSKDPYLITDNASYLSNGELQFRGSFENINTNSTKFGFIISNIDNNKEISLYSNSVNKNSFTAILKTNLLKDQHYKFYAFAESDGIINHKGELKNFISKGSSAPTINKVLPEKIYFNEIVTLEGQNFGIVPDDITVNVN